MEISIKVANVDIKVLKENHDFNSREQKILEVLLLNLAAYANSQTTKENMAINPLEKNSFDLLSVQFAWQRSISVEVYEGFVEGVNRRYKSALKMLNIEDFSIHFQENSYLLSK